MVFFDASAVWYKFYVFIATSAICPPTAKFTFPNVIHLLKIMSTSFIGSFCPFEVS